MNSTMSTRMNRRTFLQSAGVTGLGLAFGAREILASPLAAPTDAPLKISRKTNKNCSFGATVANISGIPLGGIGAGSVEIRPDGYFDDWLIFNMGNWSPEQPAAEQGPTPEFGPEALQFFLRSEQGGKVKLRRLGIREDQNDLYSLSYAQPVEAIQYDGKFPFATLRYVDETLPVQVTGLAFAPIIPYDAQTSATPGFTMAFKVKNISNAKATISLMGALLNPLATGASDRALKNTLTIEARTTTLELTSAATTGRKSCHGSMALSVTGGKHSSIQGTYRRYLGNGTWGGTRGYGSAHFSYLHAYHRDGHLPSLSCDRSLDDLLIDASDAHIEALSLAELQILKKRIQTDAFFNEFIGRIALIEPELLDSHAGLVNLAKEVRDRLNSMSGKTREHSSWGDVALESSIDLAPGEEKEVRFVLSWYFPNHFSSLGPNLGHQYEHWFKGAGDVNRFLVSNHDKHRDATIDFAENLLHTNLDAEIAFAWSAQLTTLIKSSWWCKDGRFAIWEGLGCCGLHTTDITYQGSFPIIALFPELQKRQINMGASYQRQDGRIPHFFAPDLLHVDNGFDRVDMNPQYVMMVCRDYLWTGDLDFVRKNWPTIKRAMVSTQRLDADGDGIPDSDTRRNTYDQWDLEGSPAYICSLWLGALRSAIRLAIDLKETEQAQVWTDLLAKASKSFITRLWNGEYFNLWVSDTGKDECCMSDQLSGEWYTGLMGIGHSVPKENILKAIQSVHTHNFDSEFGLLNATYPPGRHPKFKTHQNLQAAGNWTGIEYANAALMIEMGMVEEGLEVIRSVHNRYTRVGRRWNHVECGDHYFRAMSSWTTLLALTGFHLDAANQIVAFGPKVDGLVAPWFATTGYGVVTGKGRTIEVNCRSGELVLKGLKLPASSGVRVSIESRSIANKLNPGEETTHVEFAQQVVLKAGQKLKIVRA